MEDGAEGPAAAGTNSLFPFFYTNITILTASLSRFDICLPAGGVRAGLRAQQRQARRKTTTTSAETTSAARASCRGAAHTGGGIDAPARRTRRGRAEARGGAALHAGPGGGAGRVSVPAAVGMEGATRGAAMVIMIHMITIASIRGSWAGWGWFDECWE